MDRRAFLAAGLAAAAASPALAEQRQGGFVVDTLAIGGPGSVEGRKTLAAGIDAMVLDMTIFPRAPAEAAQALQRWNAYEAGPDADTLIIRTGGDFQRARAMGKVGVVIACQDASILGPSSISYSDQPLDILRQHHAAGLRVLQLTHNERNGYGDGFMEPHDGGLSMAGAAVIQQMNALGGVIDLSHCSELTTLEAIRASDKPVAITHSGCRALYPSLRNKTDEAIRLLADRGGYFGVFMMSRWLTDRPTASVDDVVDHIDHAVKLAGVGAVGFGSDQPAPGDSRPQAEKVAALAAYQARNLGRAGAEPLHGHTTCADMDGLHRMSVLAEALKRRGYGSSDRDGILGENFRRFFGQLTT
jgi:membrane dipeptidase